MNIGRMLDYESLARGARLRAFALACGMTVATLAPSVWAADPTAALEELKKGYSLKQEGKCRDAIPHFAESHRLDPQAKALLNLADCEEQVGDLVGAQKLALEARDLARAQNNTELVGVAEERLAALDKRMPHLTVRLAADAPPNSVVLLDGVRVPAASLGVPLPTNPGDHVVVVTAPGHKEKKFAAKLADAGRQDLDVGPGAASSDSSGSESTSSSSDGGPSSWDTRRWTAAGLGGVGVIGVVVGTIFGLKAISGNSDSNANGHCDASGCDSTGTKFRNDARSDATVSTIMFVVGAAAIAGGAVVWFTAPKQVKQESPRVGLSGYTTGRDSGLTLRGCW